jgi:hypothetical protein
MRRSLLTITLCYLAACSTFAQAPDTTEWLVIMGGNKVGFTRQWKNTDGTISEWFQFNDRGRGDSTVTRFREDEKGFITSFDGAGKDYYKKSVFEKFSLTNGTAHWKNSAENETAKVSGESVAYVPLKIFAGTSFRSYFKNADTTVALLPSGRQKLSILRSTNLGGTTVHLAALTGSSLNPNYVWIDETRNTFAVVSDWFSVVRKGYENKIDELLKIQLPFEQGYYTSLSKKLTKKAGKIAVINANAFDPISKTSTPGTTITIENGVIKNVTTQKITLAADYEVIDAAGKFVMPGLWDMHVHYGGGAEGLVHVASGVTNVRDMGNSEELLDRKKQLEDGLVIGPRIQALCGFIDGAGPYAGPTGAKITSVEEGKAAVKKYADLGYTQIKLYSSLKPEWVKPIAAEAHKYKLRVSGHIPAHMLAEEAIAAGYDEIQHMNMIFLNFYGKDIDTRTPLRFSTVAQKAASFDFNDPKLKKFIELLKTRKIVIDPTVSIFENMFTNEAGKMSSTMHPVADRLPPSLQRSLRSGADAIATDESQKETYRKSFESMLKMINVLHSNGVILVPGTDDFVGFVLHRELENYVRAGIPAADVLYIATLQSAKVAGRDNRYGSIEKGKDADLIIIDGNPLQNISDVRKTVTIVKGQSIYSAKELYEAVSIKGYK